MRYNEVYNINESNQLEELSKQKFPEIWEAIQYVHEFLEEVGRKSYFESSGPVLEKMWKGSRIESTFRDWGEWSVPRGEIDDGDYDWEVLSKKSAKAIERVIESAREKYPNVNIHWSPEEKNYILIYSDDLPEGWEE